MLLEGLYIPLTTPFHPDGRLNTHKLATNIARYSKTPAAGLIVLGPTGEPSLLSDEETRTTLSIAVESAAPDKVLLAGISRDSVSATLTLADFAATLSYDALLIGTPAILAAHEKAAQSQETPARELLIYFQAIADRSSLPLVLQSTSSLPISTAAIATLAMHSNVLGLYNTSTLDFQTPAFLQTASAKREVTVTPTFSAVTARMVHAADFAARRASLISVGSLSASTVAEAPPAAAASLRTRTKTAGFQRLDGASPNLLDALQGGASAIAPSFAACAPQACYEVYAAWKDADQPLAAEKQARLTPAASCAEALGPGGLKFGCDLNGYFGGAARLPLLPPSATHRAQLEKLMEGMRN